MVFIIIGSPVALRRRSNRVRRLFPVHRASDCRRTAGGGCGARASSARAPTAHARPAARNTSSWPIAPRGRSRASSPHVEPADLRDGSRRLRQVVRLACSCTAARPAADRGAGTVGARSQPAARPIFTQAIDDCLLARWPDPSSFADPLAVVRAQQRSSQKFRELWIAGVRF